MKTALLYEGFMFSLFHQPFQGHWTQRQAPGLERTSFQAVSPITSHPLGFLLPVFWAEDQSQLIIGVVFPEVQEAGESQARKKWDIWSRSFVLPATLPPAPPPVYASVWAHVVEASENPTGLMNRESAHQSFSQLVFQEASKWGDGLLKKMQHWTFCYQRRRYLEANKTLLLLSQTSRQQGTVPKMVDPGAGWVESQSRLLSLSSCQTLDKPPASVSQSAFTQGYWEAMMGYYIRCLGVCGYRYMSGCTHVWVHMHTCGHMYTGITVVVLTPYTITFCPPLDNQGSAVCLFI